MKIPALITVVALACGVAFSAQAATSSADSSKRGAVVAENRSQAKGEGLGAKTKRAFHRMGDQMRSAGHKVSKATGTDKSATNDTRSMGAPGATQQDQARQVRMDEAYNNWKSRQK
ncbi:hypothetical protein [Caenimonas soli]|uniref:hypothetical protein n=1 Tax=Caenimonas soli TaxID=2735555 RepID=UPI001555F86B|nr:hypothetical protein [Caenimonas soli]NPC58604.1 hypothetical protein [Caenimonas soli]